MSAVDNMSWRSSLPAGWHALYEQLITAIAREDEGAVVEQAKQKFGTLRVYLDRLTPETEALIDEASRQSGKTCERCGEPGALMVHPDGYYETLCEQHQGKAKRPDRHPVLGSFRVYGDGTVKKIDRGN